MEQVLVLTAIAFIGNKAIEALKYARSRDINALVTLVATHVATTAALWLAAAADVTKGFIVPGTLTPLTDLNGASKILIGLAFGAFTGKLYDFQKAVDKFDSAKQPPLTALPSGPRVVAVGVVNNG